MSLQNENNTSNKFEYRKYSYISPSRMDNKALGGIDLIHVVCFTIIINLTGCHSQLENFNSIPFPVLANDREVEEMSIDVRRSKDWKASGTILFSITKRYVISINHSICKISTYPEKQCKVFSF